MPVAVITGASKGFGRCLAEALVRTGWSVVNGSRSPADITGTTFVRTDITKGAECERLIATAVKEHGRIDLFVANAGVFGRGDIGHLDLADAERILRTNVIGTMASVAAAFRQLKQQGAGTILIIASMSSVTFRPGELAYMASKWATLGFAGSLRKEAEGSGVRVLCFCPGGMKTEIFKGSAVDTSAFMDPAAVADVLVPLIEDPGKDWLFVLPRGKPLQRLSGERS